MIGDFPDLGPVWYNSGSIANILSLAEVRKVCRVTMDTAAAPAMIVHRLNGTTMNFDEHPSGRLYIFKTNTVSDRVNAYTMISTVAEQNKLFSRRREIQAADEARNLYRKVGWPGEAEFQSLLRNNFVHNCPVTPDDAKRAMIIYCPDIATLKGKTTRSSAAPRVPTYEVVPIPAPVLKHHLNVTLCAYLFFVQGIPFFHTVPRDIGFCTSIMVPDRSYKTMLREARAALKIYKLRGFHVRDMHNDNELERIKDDIAAPIEMYVVPADIHVGEIERSIRMIKERSRACVHGLSFKRLPRLLVKHITYDTVRRLNQFPKKDEVSDTLSPVSIVTGCPP